MVPSGNLKADEFPIGKSEYSSNESQGFLGLAAAKPINIIIGLLPRFIVGRPQASGSNR